MSDKAIQPTELEAALRAIARKAADEARMSLLERRVEMLEAQVLAMSSNITARINAQSGAAGTQWGSLNGF